MVELKEPTNCSSQGMSGAQLTPEVVDLTPELRRLQECWRRLSREEQDQLYAEKFAALFAPLFAKLPLHGAPHEFPKPDALISLLGLSWQPVALMAAWAKPERMLVIGTGRSLGQPVAGEGVLSLISRIAGVDRERIDRVEVADLAEVDLYRAVRKFLRAVKLSPRNVYVDLTGGKKSMAIAAAFAGFLVGAPLVYVDYADYDDYDGPQRIPVPGTEYPRLLANPLHIFGDLELRDVCNAFNRGDFMESKHLADKVARRLYEPREAECLALLAEGYGAWDRFEFRPAREALRQAGELIECFDAQGGWSWAREVKITLPKNLSALDQLVHIEEQERVDSIEEGRPLLVWYLVAARRLLDANRRSQALLLAYAAVERYVKLCLRIDFGLDADKPDYACIEGRLDQERYAEVGRRFWGDQHKRQVPEGRIMFADGVSLLAALNSDRLFDEDFGPLGGMACERNRCEYEHGFPPKIPSAASVCRYLGRATKIIARVCGGTTDLEEMLVQYRFPQLRMDGSG